MHLVTLTEKDKRYGLVPYLVRRIHGEDGVALLYADEDGTDGPNLLPFALAVTLSLARSGKKKK